MDEVQKRVERVINPAADDEARKRIKRRLEIVAGKGEDGFEWSPETWKANLQRLRDWIEDIEDRISEPQDRIAHLRGDVKGVQHFENRIKDDVLKEYGEIKKIDLPGTEDSYSAGIHELYENAMGKLVPSMDEKMMWMALRDELNEIALEKMEAVADELQREVRLHERFNELEEDLREEKVPAVVDRKMLERYGTLQAEDTGGRSTRAKEENISDVESDGRSTRTGVEHGGGEDSTGARVEEWENDEVE